VKDRRQRPDDSNRVHLAMGNASRVEELQEGIDELRRSNRRGERVEPCAVPVSSWIAAEDLLTAWICMVECLHDYVCVCMITSNVCMTFTRV